MTQEIVIQADQSNDLPSESRQLTLMTRAKTALAEAKTLDDFKTIKNQGEAAIKYAKSCRDVGSDAIRDAQEIVRRAERGLGEMLAGMKKSEGGRPKKTGDTMSSVSTLEDMGIEKKQSSRWQAEASVPEEDFEKWVDKSRANDEELTQAGLIRFAGSGGDIKSNQNKGVIEWYTPSKYLEAARITMGSIDIDPASCKFANQTVKANTYYTKENDGLEHEWNGNIWMNPPFKASLIAAFIDKLCISYKNNNVLQAILLTNNNTDTRWWHQAAQTSQLICFTKGRISFYSPIGEIASPTNGHTLFYFGKNTQAFLKNFTQFGLLMKVNNG